MRECVSRHTKKKGKKNGREKKKRRASVTGGSSGDPAPADMSEKSTIRKLVWVFVFKLLFFLRLSRRVETTYSNFLGIRSQTKET